jgi:hypothetical protein
MFFTNVLSLDKQETSREPLGLAREQRPYLRRNLARLTIYTDENADVRGAEGLRRRA